MTEQLHFLSFFLFQTIVMSLDHTASAEPLNHPAHLSFIVTPLVHREKFGAGIVCKSHNHNQKENEVQVRAGAREEGTIVLTSLWLIINAVILVALYPIHLYLWSSSLHYPSCPNGKTIFLNSNTSAQRTYFCPIDINCLIEVTFSTRRHGSTWRMQR